MDEVWFERQLSVLWDTDHGLDVAGNIYRRSLPLIEAQRLRRMDYAAGLRVGLTGRGVFAAALRGYKRQRHAEVIDAGMFRVGFERGRFVGTRVPATTVTGKVVVGVDQVAPYAGSHFLFMPVTIGDHVHSDGRRREVTFVRQGSVSRAGGWVSLLPGFVELDGVRELVDERWLSAHGLPVVEVIPAGEFLLRLPPTTRLR